MDEATRKKHRAKFQAARHRAARQAPPKERLTHAVYKTTHPWSWSSTPPADLGGDPLDPALTPF